MLGVVVTIMNLSAGLCDFLVNVKKLFELIILNTKLFLEFYKKLQNWMQGVMRI
jgi:hypothetical protein